MTALSTVVVFLTMIGILETRIERLSWLNDTVLEEKNGIGKL